MGRVLPFVIAIAVTFGVVVGSGMVWIAFQENPQERYVDMGTGAIHYGESLSIFLPWFVMVSVVVATAELAVYVLGRLARIWK